MKPILLPALATIAALSLPACGPAAAIGTAAWWDQQHQHDKPTKAGLCKCPDCSLSWNQDSSVVPEPLPQRRPLHRQRVQRHREIVPVNALAIGEIAEFGPPVNGYTEAIGPMLADCYKLRNHGDRLAIQGEFADFLVGFVMLTDAVADRRERP